MEHCGSVWYPTHALTPASQRQTLLRNVGCHKNQDDCFYTPCMLCRWSVCNLVIYGALWKYLVSNTCSYSPQGRTLWGNTGHYKNQDAHFPILYKLCRWPVCSFVIYGAMWKCPSHHHFEAGGGERANGRKSFQKWGYALGSPTCTYNSLGKPEISFGCASRCV